jgi:hypothetical protein
MREWWRRWSARYQDTLAEYGNAAIVTYLVVFVGTLVGFYGAMRFGYQVEGSVATAGTVGAAYFATKMTQPIRIAATVLLTPVMVRAVRLVRRAPPEGEAVQAPPPTQRAP